MKTASKILSMLLLVAMCLSLMGGSAYALAPLDGSSSSDGLAPLTDGVGSTDTGSNTGTNGIFGLAPNGESTTTVSNGSDDQTVFGIFEADSGMELYSSNLDPWSDSSNGASYETLDLALEKVKGDNVMLTSNATIGSTVNIGKNITIDLNGKTLTLNAPLNVYNGAVVYIKGGTIINSSNIASVDSGAQLRVMSVTASSASFAGKGTIQVYNGCKFTDGKDPKPEHMAPGYVTDGSGNTGVCEAVINGVAYAKMTDAIAAAKSGDTIVCPTDLSVSGAINAAGVTINKNLTFNLGGNNLDLSNATITGCTVTFSGTRISGEVKVENNATVNLSSGLKAEAFNLYTNSNLYVNGAEIDTVRVYGCTVNMNSGSIGTLAVFSSDAQLKVSGGKVNDFQASATLVLPRAVTGGQWVVQPDHFNSFKAAIADGYEAVGTSPNYTVRKVGDSGSGGSDGNVYFSLYGSPYTVNSNSSVYLDLSELPTVGYYINTSKSTVGAQQISSNNYSVVSNIYGNYNYRVNFNASYLNSLANGTYYIITQFNGKPNSTIVGTLVIQGGGGTIIPGSASVWPEEDTWYSGSGMFYFYVNPDLKLVNGTQYNYYDVVIDKMQIGGDKLAYNGYQKFGVASSVMDSLAPGNHTITVLTNNGYATCNFKVGATLRAVDTDKHVIGSSKNLQFVCSQPISRVWVGGVEITNNWGDYYSLSNNSKTITLSAAFLNERTAGQTYTLTVQTTYGDQPSCTFQVLTKAQASASPQTGDESNLAMWAAVLILSGGAMVAVLPKLKKSKGN